MVEHQKELSLSRRQLALSENPILDEPLGKVGTINQLIMGNIISVGFDTPRKLLNAAPDELAKLADISMQMADDVLEEVRKEYSNTETQGNP